jgi:hypothetical protein
MDGWDRALHADQISFPNSRESTVHRAMLVRDENLLVMEIDVIVLRRGLDLAVFETSGRQKSKMVCVETCSCNKATTRMWAIRMGKLLLTCFLERLVGYIVTSVPANSPFRWVSL